MFMPAWMALRKSSSSVPEPPCRVKNAEVVCWMAAMGGSDELLGFLRSGEGQALRRFVEDFGGRADVTNFTFDEDCGADGLDCFDRRFGFGDVLLQGQRRAIENDHVETSPGGLFGPGEGVGVVGVEKNRVRELVAIGVYERGGRTHT